MTHQRWVTRVLAPNPGPFTLEGTNTWVVGRGPRFVIDPGPDDPGHVDAVRRTAVEVEAILLTHRHPDHALGARRLARRTGAPVLAFDPQGGAERLVDGQTIEAGGVALTVIHTPGHTENHVSFHEPSRGALFTGDTVLGRGTSVVDPPEGDLAAYMASLERLLGLQPSALYPGHGPTVRAGPSRLRSYLAHRRHRELQVIRELRRGARTPLEIVPAIYAGYPMEVHAAAGRSVLAHLLKLEGEGRAVRTGPPEDERFLLVRSEHSGGPGDLPKEGLDERDRGALTCRSWPPPPADDRA
jgi:glyoxylase-like metal-dependent hydrolase (beta-lactamase superfamily II)